MDKMEEEEFETTNIHTKWLENIYEQIRNIQAMQRIAKEGAANSNGDASFYYS
jgi:hypothetical protein